MSAIFSEGPYRTPTPGGQPLRGLVSSAANFWGGFVVDASAGLAILVVGVLGSESVSSSLLALAAGVLSYPFYEYGFHRWVFHLPRAPGAAAHQMHHDDAKGLYGTPFFLGPCVVGLSWLAISPLVGKPLAAAYAGTLLLCFFGHSVLHYAMHHRRGRGGQLYRRLRRRHLIHHRIADKNYGVVSSVWDRLLGTELVKQRKP